MPDTNVSLFIIMLPFDEGSFRDSKQFFYHRVLINYIDAF